MFLIFLRKLVTVAAVALLTALVPGCSDTTGPGVQLELNATPTAPVAGGLVTLVIRNTGLSEVDIQTCSGPVIDRFEGNRWIPGTLYAACTANRPYSTRVASGGLLNMTFRVDSAGRFRARANVLDLKGQTSALSAPSNEFVAQ